MVKIILEKADIEKLITIKYKCKDGDISGLDDKIEVIVQIEDFIPPQHVPAMAPSDGAKPTTRKTTIPGKAMGIERSRLPVF